jgi:gamma-glutamyltranspeptidase/glutathione hydrolase
MRLLEAGGNAFDAARLRGFVLQVVEPHLNGPGGDLPIVLYSAVRDDVIVVCGQGPAPAAATTERFRELGLDLVPGTGVLPACVPGAFDAWLRMLLELGTASLRDVLEPAIGYARDGHPVLPRVAASIASLESTFRDDWPTSAETWLPAPEAWSLFRRPVLADTYTRLLEEAEPRPPIATGRSRRPATRGIAASSQRRSGLLRGDGGARQLGPRTPRTAHRRGSRRVRGVVRAAHELSYEGWTVYKTGPWGQGPVLLQLLSLLDGFDLSSMGAGSASSCTRCSSARSWRSRTARRGTATRHSSTSRSTACSPATTRTSAGARVGHGLRGAHPGTRGRPVAGDPRNRLVLARGAGEPTRGDTCHLDVVDRFGNVVSATPSGGWLQSSPVVPGLGFPLGTRAQMFWLEDGLPNSLEPRKRPRTTLSPSLARRGDEVLSFGTPGGDQQDQWSLVFFLHHVLFEQNLQAAIDLPMFHSNHFPSSFYPREAKPRHVELEARFAPEVVDELHERGHDVDVTDEWSLGRLSAASRDAGGTLRAAANPRGMQGYAVGADWVASLDPWPEEFGLGRMRMLLDALGNPHQRYPRSTSSGRTASRRDADDRGAPRRHGAERRRVSVAARARLERADPERRRGGGLRARDRQRARGRGRGRRDPVRGADRGGVRGVRRDDVDAAVVEAGLGGRYDATNVLDAPVVLLTNVGLDHVDVLGDTREAIAREKLAVAAADAIVVMPDAEFARLVPGRQVLLGGCA